VQAYLGAGHPLLSDQGRVLATVVADSSGHHDTLCGMTDAGRAKMLLAAIKHGLDIRDVAPSGVIVQGASASATMARSVSPVRPGLAPRSIC